MKLINCNELQFLSDYYFRKNKGNLDKVSKKVNDVLERWVMFEL